MSIVKLVGNKKEVMFYSGKWYIADKENEYDEIEAQQKAATYLKNLQAVWQDLPRTFFMPTQDKHYSDFIKLWTKICNQSAYIQGDMDGGDIFLLCFIATDKNVFNTLGLNVDHVNFLLSLKSIRIAYFDDDNTPCGISIEYSTLVPSLWTITMAQNTNAGMLKKKITHFAPESLMMRKQYGELLDHKQINDELLPLLNSKELSEKLSGLIKHDETIDYEMLDRIGEELGNIQMQFRELIQAQHSKFDAIYKEVTQLPDYDDESSSIDEMNARYKAYLVNRSTTLHSIKVATLEFFKDLDTQTKAFQDSIKDKMDTVDSLLADYQQFEAHQKAIEEQLASSFMHTIILGSTILVAFVCLGRILGKVEDEVLLESVSNEYTI